MSYILDALRRADAERDRGAVPGLHTQPAYAGAAPHGPRDAGPPWGWIAAGLIAVVAVAGVGWAWLGGARSNEADRVAIAPTATAPAPAALTTPTALGAIPAAGATAAMPVAPAAIPPAGTITSTVRPGTGEMPVTPPAARVAPTPPATNPLQTGRAPSRTSAGTAAPKAATGGQTTPATAAAEAHGTAASAPRVYALAELPDDVRRQLPAVNVGGSMYSPVAANRVLIVNGQVLHEGDAVAPGVVLQQIRLKGAVLAFGGYRYEIAY